MPKIGGHVSAAISLEKSFEKAMDIGAQMTQIFIAPPQQWMHTKHDDFEIERYKELATVSGIGPNFIHGTYLVNLGTDKPEHLKKSVDWLIYSQKMAGKLGISGTIFHPGSHKGRGFEEALPQITESLKQILAVTPDNVLLILETSAGAGGTIGRDFREIGEIIKIVQDERLKVCVDTQHIFAAGYDIRTALGVKDVMQEFDEEIGLANLAAVHANDSKTDYKSNRDRHENIGEGFIGEEGFSLLINHPSLQETPFILEVPGFAGNGPDKENVEKLRSLIQS